MINNSYNYYVASHSTDLLKSQEKFMLLAIAVIKKDMKSNAKKESPRGLQHLKTLYK